MRARLSCSNQTMSSANTERSPADRSNALAKSITGAATLISANAFARILTFVLNQILVMYFTTPAVLGTVHVQLELLLSTILFVGREPARMTVLRGRIATGPKDDRTRVSSSARTFLQSLVNLSYISILIGTCLTAVATALLGPNGSDRAANSPYLLYAAASVIELLSEPLYLVAQHRLMLSQRARVEAFAATAKTGAIVLAMGYHSYLVFSEGTQSTGLVSESQAIFSFAIGQLAYGVAIFLGWTYEWFMEFKRLSKAAGAAKKREGATMTRSKAAELASDEDNILYSAGFSLFLPTWVNNSAVTGWWFGFAMYPSYFFQSLVKFLLNEGDRILLNWLATAQQQGVWAFVFNYGERRPPGAALSILTCPQDL